MTPGQRARLARAKRRRRAEELQAAFESLSGSDQLAWLVSNGTTLAELLSDDGDAPQAGGAARHSKLNRLRVICNPSSSRRRPRPCRRLGAIAPASRRRTRGSELCSAAAGN